MRSVIALLARTFGWSLSEIKRMPLGELLEYAGLAAREAINGNPRGA